MISIIVAYDKNYGIGVKNDLPWGRDLPADLKRFKDLTSGHSVIMGYNTFKSIGKPLPNRRNIVISYSNLNISGIEVVDSLDGALKIAEENKETYIIGGGQIYSEAIALVDRIDATEVDHAFDNIDTYFPRLDKNIWREECRIHYEPDENNRYPYDFVTYLKK